MITSQILVMDNKTKLKLSTLEFSNSSITEVMVTYAYQSKPVNVTPISHNARFNKTIFVYLGGSKNRESIVLLQSVSGINEHSCK